MDNLYNCLKRVRLKCCLSQEELAARVGLSRNSISSIETGQCCPSAYTAALICQALHCKFEDIFYIR